MTSQKIHKELIRKIVSIQPIGKTMTFPKFNFLNLKMVYIPLYSDHFVLKKRRLVSIHHHQVTSSLNSVTPRATKPALIWANKYTFCVFSSVHPCVCFPCSGFNRSDMLCVKALHNNCVDGFYTHANRHNRIDGSKVYGVQFAIRKKLLP